MEFLKIIAVKFSRALLLNYCRKKMKLHAYLFLFFLAIVPYIVAGSWNTLLPNGPIYTNEQLKLQKPKSLEAVKVTEKQPVQPHVVPPPKSAQEFQSQVLFYI